MREKNTVWVMVFRDMFPFGVLFMLAGFLSMMANNL